MKPKVTYLSFLLGILFISSTTVPNKEKINWMSLKEAEEKLRIEKKPVLIDLYADWCGWCKVMDKKTYTNTGVIRYINQNFYPVRIDAETKESLTWRGREYQYQPNYRVNGYAMYLTGGQLQLPTTVIFPSPSSDPQAIPGYLETNDMELILKYFGEGHYGKIPFLQFQKNFKPSW